MRSRFIATALLALTAALPAPAGDVAWWEGSLEDALARAARDDALVMVDAWAEWCMPCKLLEEEVFPEARVAAELARGIIPMRIEVDVNKGVGTDFGREHDVSGLPLVLFFDGSGRVVHRVESYLPAPLFLDEIAWARIVSVPLEELEARAVADPTGENLLNLAERHRREGRPEEAARAYRLVLTRDPRGEQDAADDALFFLAGQAIVARDNDTALEHLRRATEDLVPGSRTREAFYTRLELLQSLGKVDEILGVYDAMATILADDARVLSDYAWYLAELGRDLEQAESAAREAIALEPDYGDAWDTLGRVLFRAGRLEEAVEAAEKAVTLDEGNVLYRERRLEYVQALRRRMREGG